MSISKNRIKQKQIQLAIMVANAGLKFESESRRKNAIPYGFQGETKFTATISEADIQFMINSDKQFYNS